MVCRPPPTLADYVRAYYSYREAPAGRVVRRKVPGGCVTVVIGFEQPLLVDGRKHTSFVTGMHDGPSITEQAGVQHGLQIDLTPLRCTSSPTKWCPWPTSPPPRPVLPHRRPNPPAAGLTERHAAQTAGPACSARRPAVTRLRLRPVPLPAP